MAEQPVSAPYEELNCEQPQSQQAGCMQGQSGAYPQGQPDAYPQGQPGAYPQGQPGQPVVYPPGPQVAYPLVQPYYPQVQPVVYQSPGQQQVLITEPGNPTNITYVGTNKGCCGGPAIAEHYNEKGGFATGVIHLIIGILFLIMGGASYVFTLNLTGVGYGYEIGSAIIFYIPTGILGISSKNKTSRVIIAYMVFAIFSAIDAIGIIGYNIQAAFIVLSYYHYYRFHVDVDIAVHSVLAFLAFVEFIVAIVSAVYCCRGSACCCAPPPTNQGVGATVLHAQPHAQPMVVVGQLAN